MIRWLRDYWPVVLLTGLGLLVTILVLALMAHDTRIRTTCAEQGMHYACDVPGFTSVVVIAGKTGTVYTPPRGCGCKP